MHHSIRTPFFSCDFVRKPRHSSTIPAFSSASHGKNSRFAGACLTSLAPLVLYKLSFLSPSFPHSTHSTPVQKDLTTPACPHATPILLFNPFLLCVPSVTLLLCVTFLYLVPFPNTITASSTNNGRGGCFAYKSFFSSHQNSAPIPATSGTITSQ